MAVAEDVSKHHKRQLDSSLALKRKKQKQSDKNGKPAATHMPAGNVNKAATALAKAAAGASDSDGEIDEEDEVSEHAGDAVGDSDNDGQQHHFTGAASKRRQQHHLQDSDSDVDGSDDGQEGSDDEEGGSGRLYESSDDRDMINSEDDVSDEGSDEDTGVQLQAAEVEK